MEIQTTKIESLTWDYDAFGRFSAILTDNQLSRVELYRVTGQENGALVTDDIEYVRAVHHAIGELLSHMDKQGFKPSLLQDNQDYQMAKQILGHSMLDNHLGDN